MLVNGPLDANTIASYTVIVTVSVSIYANSHISIGSSIEIVPFPVYLCTFTCPSTTLHVCCLLLQDQGLQPMSRNFTLNVRVTEAEFPPPIFTNLVYHVSAPEADYTRTVSQYVDKLIE